MDSEVIFLDNNGNVKKCDILFTYFSEEFNKNFIVYTDNWISDSGELNVLFGSYKELSDKMKIDDVTDPKEVEFVGKMIDDYFAALED